LKKLISTLMKKRKQKTGFRAFKEEFFKRNTKKAKSIDELLEKDKDLTHFERKLYETKPNTKVELMYVNNEDLQLLSTYLEENKFLINANKVMSMHQHVLCDPEIRLINQCYEKVVYEWHSEKKNESRQE